MPQYDPLDVTPGGYTCSSPPSSFDEAYATLVDAMLSIHEVKRNDYTAGSPDSLRNYRATGQFLGTSAYEVMLARLFEKLQRCKSLLLEGTERKVLDESTADTLLDIANIALLIAAGLESGDDGR